MEHLARQLRLWQLIAGGALALAGVAVVLSIIALGKDGAAKPAPEGTTSRAPDKLRFATDKGSVEIDGDGIELRTATSRLHIGYREIAMTGAGEVPSIHLTVAPSKRNPWAGISMSTSKDGHAGFQARVARGGNMLTIRSPKTKARAAFMWASKSALISVKDRTRRERIELQTGGEGLDAPQVMVEQRSRDRVLAPPPKRPTAPR